MATLRRLRPWPTAAFVLALYLAFIAALHHVYLIHPPFDVNLLNQIHRHATPSLTLLAKTLSFIGSPRTLWPAVLISGVIVWRSGLHAQAAFLLATMASSGLLETLVKLAARRPRPDVSWAYVRESTYSFPSGHATLALALYGSILYLTRHRSRSQRISLAAFCVAMILGIGLSRIYLGAHNPTDVLAGYLTGAACLIAAMPVSSGQSRPHRPSG